MGITSCFKCGSDETGALLVCSGCGTTPRTNSELALSLVLTDHLSSISQLAHYGAARGYARRPVSITLVGDDSANNGICPATAPVPAQPARNIASLRARAQRK